MSREEVFEYFIDVEELEPFCSELPAWATGTPPAARRERPARVDSSDVPEAPSATEEINVPVSPPREVARSSAPVEVSAQQEAETLDPSASTAEAEQPKASIAAPVVESGDERTRQEPTIEPVTRSRVRRFVSVHALGQSAFCVRSAILALEDGDERDVDEPLPRLTYLPNLEREKIEELLSNKLRGLGVSLLYATSLFIFMVVGVIRQERMLFYPALLVGILYIVWLANTLAEVVQLAARRRAAINAEAREPDPKTAGIQAVNWWSMLKAGFEPVSYQQPIRHPEMPLEGCPWRVLERGSVRIPVIRSSGDKLGMRPGELYPKHLARLSAYAILLEASGHIEVPFGLIFPTDSPKGFAVRITPSLREKTVATLEELVTTIRDSEQRDVEPRPPENRNRCARCQYGEPIAIRPKEITSARRSGTRLLVLQHGSGATYRCQCGDRFGSAPPHAKSIRLGLSAALD